MKNESAKVSSLHDGHSNTKKRIDLHNLIETHKPNIIIGTESHLDSTIASSEIFPDNFQNPYRKDRKLGEGRDNNYITTSYTL
jgi:hypothetical protein